VIVIPENKTIPPTETIKINTINRLDSIQDIYTTVQYYFYLKTYPKTKIAMFKASIISFYSGQRPKLLDYIKTLEIAEKKGDEKNEDIEGYRELVHFMDMYVDRPSTFSLEDCIEVYKWLNQFCEEYGLTKTSFKREEMPDLN
jgi:hypothetical protein